MAPTNTPTPVPTPATATLSLDEYLTQCTPSSESADTYGEISALAGEHIQRLEAMVPPAELAEWHRLQLDVVRDFQVIVDGQPKDGAVDFDEFAALIVMGGLEEKEIEASSRLPENVRKRLQEAECANLFSVEGSVESVTLTDLPEADDHGNDFESATRIAVGETVAIVLKSSDDKDVLVFLAEPAAAYVITLQLDGAYVRATEGKGPIVALYDAGGQELARLEEYDFFQNKIMWQAVTAGDHYIAVGDGAISASFTLTVTGGEATEQLERDDHGNSEGDATAIGVGADVRGALDYDDDIDYFRFQAEQGKFYQIDVALGTLDDSELLLLDSDGWELAYNDDHGDTYASRLYWEAPSSGERYVLVGGAYTSSQGTYTLTVSLSDLIDDHGNDIDDATAIGVGADVRGALNYDDDIDYFRFQAERGQSYQIDVALGTLDDSIVDLYDTDWSFLDTNDDYGDTYASRLYWEAPSSGERYVLVGGAYTSSQGTYTLTVSSVGDHGNATNSGNTSYDTDGDGLIEVSDLMQLNAIRWDLDGDGSPASNATGYNAAFPNATAGMGCPDSGCSGYELISDLDFDTNGNGRADAGDAYWNDGEGWVPIGDDTNNSAFRTFFNGGGHTISNLYIDRRDARYIGLFGITWFDGISRGRVGLNNSIRDLALVNVDVQGGLYTGGLAGANNIVIVACSVTGVVNGNIKVGGLVGRNPNGTVIASYSTASVGYAEEGFGERGFGGLVGSNYGGTIIASYSIGSVTSDFGEVGGLGGSNFADRGTTRDSYWDTQTSGQSESAGGEGKTTSELQSPTGYTGIYENWNVDLDEDGVGDDLWDFGTPNQYPTLRS